MSEMKFHKCYICGRLFYNGKRAVYCRECVKKSGGGRMSGIRLCDVVDKKARDRLRWHLRMSDPLFRERERQRSLRRYYADCKYAVRSDDEHNA